MKKQKTADQAFKFLRFGCIIFIIGIIFFLIGNVTSEEAFIIFSFPLFLSIIFIFIGLIILCSYKGDIDKKIKIYLLLASFIAFFVAYFFYWVSNSIMGVIGSILIGIFLIISVSRKQFIKVSVIAIILIIIMAIVPLIVNNYSNRRMDKTYISGCFDSDGEKNYYKYGFVSLSNKHKVGYDCCKRNGIGTCVSEADYLIEVYCENEILKQEAYKCPNGCKDGVCI